MLLSQVPTLKYCQSIFHISFQSSSFQKERAQIICARLLDPTHEICKVITEAEAVGKGLFLHNIPTIFKSNSTSYIRFSIFKPFSMFFINPQIQVNNQQTTYLKWLQWTLKVFYLKLQKLVKELSTTFVNHC